VEVVFEDLAVEADVRVDHRTLPTLLNSVVNAAKVRTWQNGRIYETLSLARSSYLALPRGLSRTTLFKSSPTVAIPSDIRET
jgi:hypothetical protein